MGAPSAPITRWQGATMASGFRPFAVRRRGGWNHLPFLPFPRRAQRPFAVRRRGDWKQPDDRGRVPHVMAGVDGRGKLRGPPGGFPGCRSGAIAGSSRGFPPPSSGTGRSPLYLIEGFVEQWRQRSALR